MKFTPFQLAAIAVGGFASIVLLNILAQARSNEEFKDRLLNISPTDLIPMRAKRVAEENMEQVSIPVPSEDINDNDDGDDDDE